MQKALEEEYRKLQTVSASDLTGVPTTGGNGKSWVDGYLCINHTKPVVGGLERPIPPQLWDDSRGTFAWEKEREREKEIQSPPIIDPTWTSQQSESQILPSSKNPKEWSLISPVALEIHHPGPTNHPSTYSPLLTPTGRSQPWPLPLHSRRVYQPSEERREGAAHSQESSLTHSLTHPPVHPFD